MMQSIDSAYQTFVAKLPNFVCTTTISLRACYRTTERNCTWQGLVHELCRIAGSNFKYVNYNGIKGKYKEALSWFEEERQRKRKRMGKQKEGVGRKGKSETKC